MNDESESCFGCDCACRRPPTAEDLAVREGARAGIAARLDRDAPAPGVARRARLTRGEWTDAGAGLQVRLA